MAKKSKRNKVKDPFLDREKEKYQHPVPSREYIMEHMAKKGQLMTYQALADELNLSSEHEIEAIRRRLKAMTRDGQLHCNRKRQYGLISKMDLIPGHVKGHKEGFGIFIPDDTKKHKADYVISDYQMRQVFHGDRVLVRQGEFSRRGKRECQIIEVLESKTQQLVGRYYFKDGISYVVPDHKRISQHILIPDGETLGAKNGQIVYVQITSQPTLRNLPIGRISEVIGEHMGPGMEINAAIRSHNLRADWDQAALEQAKALPKRVVNKDKEGRVDLRDLPFVTIDGDDAKDFDDAVFCDSLKSGWHLYVAIADVSHYVQPGSPLDVEASKRGTSVYFPGRVIPMLPTQLSNGLCSLNPRVERLAMVCKISLTSKGRVRKYEFFQGLIRSHARLTYDRVSKMLEHGDKKLRLQYRDLLPHLEDLYTMYKVLLKCRRERGTIDFEIPETKIIFSKDKKISKIVPQERNEAHRLIEECMLLANVSAANYLLKHKIHILYRVHGGPDPEKLIKLKEFLKPLGLALPKRRKPTPGDYSDILDQAMDRPDGQVIQMMLLRSMGQAVYQPKNVGHFGLAYDAYCHFTSPIRRYPDLLVHRAIKHLLTGAKAKTFIYDLKQMTEYGEHCSSTERKADDATRDVTDWLKCEFMQDKVGEIFQGVVSSVMPFGLFISLNDIFVEGLLHVTSLKNDYYHFSEASHALIGELSGMRYKMGDPVEVLVSRVSLDDRMIDFELASSPKKLSKRVTKKQKKKHKR